MLIDKIIYFSCLSSFWLEIAGQCSSPLVIDENEGNIRLDSYPGNYASNSDCTWIIDADAPVKDFSFQMVTISCGAHFVWCPSRVVPSSYGTLLVWYPSRVVPFSCGVLLVCYPSHPELSP